MPDPRTKRKKSEKNQYSAIKHKAWLCEAEGNLLFIKFTPPPSSPPKPYNSSVFNAWAAPLSAVLSSGNLTFVVRTGLKRAREVRSALTYWSKPPSALQQKTSCFGFGEETISAWNIFYTQLRSACRALRLIQIFSDQISKILTQTSAAF